MPSCGCPTSTTWSGAAKACKPYRDRLHDKKAISTCQQPAFGNPIYPLTGSKSLVEELGRWSIGGIRRVVLGYDTRRKVPANDPSLIFNPTGSASFGELWASSLHKTLVFQLDANGLPQAIQSSRGGGAWTSFIRDGSGNYAPDADVSDRLIPISAGWRYFDAAERSEETYDSLGKLLTVAYANGATLSYTYSDTSTPIAVAPVAGLLIRVQDQLGRSVQFQYEQPSGVITPRVQKIVDPNAQVIGALYDASNNLSQLNWPDGKIRRYLYERSDIAWAVTGIVDENTSRLATYAYDALGRATDTQWAGGVDHFSATYTTPPTWNIVETYDSVAGVVWRDHYWQQPQGTVITRPSGSTSSLSAALVQGMPRLTSQSQPAGSGCQASMSAQSYDPNGNLASRDDFNGTRACYASDLSRNLETTRVEGLAGATACGPVITVNAALPSGSRKTSSQWHPDWRLATKVAEPGRITTSVYNGQPDPFAGNATASCAPSTALLPDGKPIVVLCKEVQQATTDATGASGFTAPLQSGVPNRVQQWTYNAFGQMLTSKDALNNTTTNTYYADTAFTGADPNAVGHTLGDLQTTTNAVGKVTQYTKYNKSGQLLESIDPNGVVTTNSYDLRQRLLSSSIGGQTTGYSYDPVGQLLKVTAPDASWVGYEYDPAHRLIATKDNLGNRIDLTLDNAGNIKEQNVRDPGGALARSMTRTYDALGRVQQTTGRP